MVPECTGAIYVCYVYEPGHLGRTKRGRVLLAVRVPCLEPRRCRCRRRRRRRRRRTTSTPCSTVQKSN